MTAWESIAANRAAPKVPPFEVRRAAPDGAPAPTPLVFASPHSGRLYPDDMMAAAALDAVSIRRSEDAYVDELVGAGPALGAAMISANLARAYIDVNREAFELDQGMFADELPDFARARTAYRAGFLTNMSNPKTLAFVASLFATTSVIHAPLWVGLLGVVLMIAMSTSYYLACLWLLTRSGSLAFYMRAERFVTAGAGTIFTLFGLQLVSRGFFA